MTTLTRSTQRFELFVAAFVAFIVAGCAGEIGAPGSQSEPMNGTNLSASGEFLASHGGQGAGGEGGEAPEPDPEPDPCDPNPCVNDGVCMADAEGYTCDCSATAYEGEHCQTLLTYSVSGQIVGLPDNYPAAVSINGSDAEYVYEGYFTLSEEVGHGTEYTVTAEIEGYAPCDVYGGTGTISADVHAVIIDCGIGPTALP